MAEAKVKARADSHKGGVVKVTARAKLAHTEGRVAEREGQGQGRASSYRRESGGERRSRPGQS